MKQYLLVIAALFLIGTSYPLTAKAEQTAWIVDFDEQQPEVTVQGKVVRVVGGNGLTLSVYNVAGVMVKQVRLDSSDCSFDLNLPKGCYILKVGKMVRKVSIK